MYDDSKKLFLVEALLKENDDDILKEIEKVLTKQSSKKITSGKFSNIPSILSKDEVEEFGSIIEKGCEQINPDDWK